MIKRHERTQLFRELPGDCCSSLVTSLSEQKESPILQGDWQLLGSVRESLIAAGGGAAALMWARTAGGCWGESHSSHFCPQGTWSRTETFHTGGFFISFYGCLVLVPPPPHKLQLLLQQDRAQLGFFAVITSWPAQGARCNQSWLPASNLQGWVGSWPNRKSHVSLGSAASPGDEKYLTGHKYNFACSFFVFFLRVRLLSQGWTAYVIVARLFFSLFFLKEHSCCILITTFRTCPNSLSSNWSCFSARKLVFHLLL